MKDTDDNLAETKLAAAKLINIMLNMNLKDYQLYIPIL